MRLEFQLEALPKLIRQAGFKSRRVVCSIPASHTVCKHLQLVRIEGVAMADQIASAIAAQLECDTNALVFRHIEIESEYYVPLELPLYVKEVRFSPHAEGIF